MKVLSIKEPFATLIMNGNKKYLNRPMFLDIIDKQEYLLGHYELGRYAWVLDNIEIIEPIKAKGKLNIWNFNKK